MSRKTITKDTFYQFHPQGAVADRTNSTGIVTSASISDAFGIVSNSSVITDPFGYDAQDGYYTDQSTGFILAGFRYYDPGAGRFLNRDPIGYEGGINDYGYVGNDPENEDDPEGTEAPGVPIKGGSYHETSQQAVNLLIFLAGLVQPEDEPEIIGAEVGADAGEAAAEQGANDAGSAACNKTGPKVNGGPHNDTIARRIEELRKENPDWEHTHGGNLTEQTIKIDGGIKSARRPDITFKRPDGSLYHEQVGRLNANGDPVTREVGALDDLENATGIRPKFTPY